MFPAPPTDYSPEFAIYNDGVPSSVFFGEHPEHSVVQHRDVLLAELGNTLVVSLQGSVSIFQA